MSCGDFESEIGAEVAADEENGRGGDVAGADEVLQSGFGVFAPALLAGVHEMALAVAAVVECEDVEGGLVEWSECGEDVCKVAGLAVKVNNGEARL